MAHEQNESTASPTTPAPAVYPFIFSLALANGQYLNQPAQYCVSRCVCCDKVQVILVLVRHFKIIKQLAESWQELSNIIAPNLGGTFCPNCRPPGEDWDIVRPDGKVGTTIHRPGREAAQAYLDQNKTQYQNCILQPRAPTP